LDSQSCKASSKARPTITLTPTAQSSAIAGFALWLVGWATFFKMHAIPVIGKFVNQENATAWIAKNKVLTMLITEIFNFGVHGISNPASVTFALGGTAFNTLMIFIILPVTQWSKKRRSHHDILQGVPA
jgi:hypothetical protein